MPNSQRGTEDIIVNAQFSQIMEQQKVFCLCGKLTMELKDWKVFQNECQGFAFQTKSLAMYEVK